MASMIKSPAIGIDLGTTFSCVGIFETEGVQILTNQDGSKIMPSYVAFPSQGKIIGEHAKSYADLNPENTVHNVKRLIGRVFRDPSVQADIQNFPYEVIESSGKILIRVKQNDQPTVFHPEEISAMILKQMKITAERYLGQPVKDAVITVPAYFTDSQRRATQDAGRIAELNVLGIINEPTAAALAYGFDNLDSGEHKLLVYDFGGGTFDVSILSVSDGNFEVISTDGNTHLGGEDIDNILVKTLAREFQRLHGLNISKNARALRRLRTACEKAKIELSSQQNATITLDHLVNGQDFSYSMSRCWFEDVCSDIFKETLMIVERALSQKNTDKASITDVLLVGGSTRIPLIRQLLKDFFGTNPLSNINPDEAVAYGAAIQAAILSGIPVRNIRLRDVTPLSLGISAKGEVMAKLIERNTPIPVKRTKEVTTGSDNQTMIQFEVFEGERAIAKENVLLGEFALMGLPPAPRGVVRLPLTFDLDVNGILKVCARDPGSGREKSLTLTNRSCMTPEKIDQAIERAASMAEEDMIYLRKAKARDVLEIYIEKINCSLKNIKERVSAEDLKRITEKLDESTKKLREKGDEASSIQYENMQNELEEIWTPIVIGLYPDNGGEAFRPALHVVPSGDELGDDRMTRSEWIDLGLGLEDK